MNPEPCFFLDGRNDVAMDCPHCGAIHIWAVDISARPLRKAMGRTVRGKLKSVLRLVSWPEEESEATAEPEQTESLKSNPDCKPFQPQCNPLTAEDNLRGEFGYPNDPARNLGEEVLDQSVENK